MRLLFVLLFFAGSKAYSLSYGCQIDPSQLDEVGTRIVQNYSRDGQPIPDSMVVNSDVMGHFNNTGRGEEKYTYATLEGFYRPAEDDFYVLPIPIFGASLSRERNVIYICAHMDSERPEHNHMTIYMMRGYHLEPTSLSTLVGDVFKSPQLKVKPLNLSLLTTGAITRKLIPVMRWLSIFDMGVKMMDGIQRILTNMLGDVFGLGVERITVTEKYLELANGVDLNQPDRSPRIVKRIPIAKKR